MGWGTDYARSEMAWEAFRNGDFEDDICDNIMKGYYDDIFERRTERLRRLGALHRRTHVVIR